MRVPISLWPMLGKENQYFLLGTLIMMTVGTNRVLTELIFISKPDKI